MRKAVQILGILAMVGATTGLSQASFTVQLTPSIASGAPVGSSIMWTATVTGTTNKPNYRFTVTSGTVTKTIRDFSNINTLPWTELTEGTYDVIVYVQASGQQVKASSIFKFTSRVTGGTPVVSTTVHPLVALYSAPVCATGTVQVQFWPTSGKEAIMSTSPQTCNGATSLNFEVAGMLPSSTYKLRQVTTVNGSLTYGPQLSFQTGATAYPIPPFQPVTPPNSETSTTERLMLTSFKTTHGSSIPYPPTATDLYGNVLWYYWDPENPINPPNGYLTRPVAGGTILMLLSSKNIIREADFLGNIVHESNASRLSAQLKAMGTDPVGWLSHEALRLPNGHTVTLGSAERLYTNVQGPGTVDVVDDIIVDMDENFQVTWYWNAFDFLNVAYPAVLGEKCGQEGKDHCGHLTLAPTANDWTHANTLHLLPDGNLVISLRDLDWVVKVNYENGAGDGHVMWTLGPNGNCGTPGCTSPFFTINFDNSWPWFSHQHDVEFDGTNYELYDNGNTRVSKPPLGQGHGNSRGYVFSMDETNMSITVLLAQDLNYYCPGFGSAQLLANGDYFFLSGNISGDSSQPLEVLPNGTFDYAAFWPGTAYRAFRMKDLYTYTDTQ